MLVQLNRQQDRRPFTATATDLPLNPATTRSMSPVVAVFGHPGRVAGLAAHLPHGWQTRRPGDFDDVRADEIVLLAQAGVHDVTAARAVLPRRTRVVAL